MQLAHAHTYIHRSFGKSLHFPDFQMGFNTDIHSCCRVFTEALDVPTHLVLQLHLDHSQSPQMTLNHQTPPCI